MDVTQADASLFAPLTDGERADALRTLTEDARLATMAKVGRYRVISVEPMVAKPPRPHSGSRLARVVVYDYSSDRCLDACVDLERGVVAALKVSSAQPMLARDEETAAIAVAMASREVRAKLSADDTAQVAMHYWGSRKTDLSYRRRSAAVIFGKEGERPALVAVVDLLANQVSEIVAAEQW